MKQISFPIPSYDEWKQEVERSLKGKPIDQLYSTTYEHIQLKPIYTRADLEGMHVEQYPGFPSYVRGTKAEGYIKKGWEVSQQCTASTPERWNALIKQQLERGQTEIHVVLPKLNFSVQTLEQVEAMFSNICLEDYSLRMDTGACSLSFFSLFVEYMKKSGQPLNRISGTIGMDPLGTLAIIGKLPVPLAHLYDTMADVTKWATTHMPHVKTIIVHADPYHNGGGNAIQQLAFAFATAVEYINECLERGLTIDEVAQRIDFSFPVGSHFFMEIAKLRAARLIWTNIVQAFGGSEQSQKLFVHACTSYFTKTVYDPYVNMLRATTEAFAAIVGGVDSLHVSPFNEPFATEDELAARIARNTQLILREEAHMGKVIDPAGGSYYVETLTAQVAEQAWKLFQQIEAQGGMTSALQRGFVQAEIENIAKQREQHVKKRKEKIVGTNVYANLAESTAPKHVYAPYGKTHMYVNVKTMEDALSLVQRRAIAQYGINENESPAITVLPIRQWRISEPFEQLRQASERHAEKNGKRPTVHLVNLGAIPKHKVRADFITGFFEAGGFAVIKNDGYMTVEEAVNGVLQTNGTHYIICGTDNDYVDAVPHIVRQVKAERSDIRIYVAGKPSPDVEVTFTEAGVDGYIHIGSNCYDTVLVFMKEMGVNVDGESEIY